MRYIVLVVVLYPIRRTYICSTRIQIYFMTFTIQWMTIIEDKLTTIYQFYIILISVFKLTKDFFDNFICFIINYDFYVINFWIHYTLFIIIYRRNKLFAIVHWIYHVPVVLRLFMMSLKFSLISLRYSLTESVLFSSVNFLFNTIVTPIVTYSYWFIIIFIFFMLRNILNMSKYSMFICFNFFF